MSGFRSAMGVVLTAAMVGTLAPGAPAMAQDEKLQDALTWLDRIGAMRGSQPWTLEDLATTTNITFNNDAKRLITDSDLIYLTAIPNLRMLDLGGSVTEGLTDAGMAHVAAIPNLERLTVAATSVGDDGVAYLAGHPNLAVVNLSSTPITDVAMETLASLPSLREAQLNSTAITDAGLATLTTAQGLETLWLQNASGITDAGLEQIGALPNLRTLILDFSPINGGLEHLADLDGLQNLQLMATSTDDAGAAHLANLESLTQLGLWQTGITDATMPVVAGLPNLTNLRLDRTAVTDDGLAMLAGSSSLTHLYLAGAESLNGEGFAALTGLPLHTIDVSRIEAIDDDDILVLGDIETLQSINLRNTSVTDAGIERLTELLPDARPTVSSPSIF